MNPEKEMKRVLQVSDHIQSTANIVEARELANKMMQGIVHATDDSVDAATGVVAIVLAAAGVLHLSMSQMQEKLTISKAEVRAFYGAYQLIFGQFLAQMGSNADTKSSLDTGDVMGAVEELLGITKNTEETQ